MWRANCLQNVPTLHIHVLPFAVWKIQYMLHI